MKRRYTLSKPAERDLDEIQAYLVKEVGIAIARKVVRDLRRPVVPSGLVDRKQPLEVRLGFLNLVFD